MSPGGRVLRHRHVCPQYPQGVVPPVAQNALVPWGTMSKFLDYFGHIFAFFCIFYPFLGKSSVPQPFFLENFQYPHHFLEKFSSTPYANSNFHGDRRNFSPKGLFFLPFFGVPPPLLKTPSTSGTMTPFPPRRRGWYPQTLKRPSTPPRAYVPVSQYPAPH